MRSTLLHAAQILQDAQGAQEAGERPRLCVLHEFPPRSQVQDETGAKGVLPSPGDALDKGSAIMPIIICKLRLNILWFPEKYLMLFVVLRHLIVNPPVFPCVLPRGESVVQQVHHLCGRIAAVWPQRRRAQHG